MRLGRANQASDIYMCQEAYLNNLKLISINSATEYALGVAIVDASGNIVVPTGVATTIGDGRQTVATAGTRVQLIVASTSAKRVTICALAANTGVIVVGGSTVVASAATRRGIPLNALDSIKIEVNELNIIYIDSTVNGEGVSFIYEN